MSGPASFGGGLYLVTDASIAGGRDLVEIVERAVAGGVRVVQLREKDLETRPFLERARAIREVLAGTGVPLLINDRVDIALACGADGVHVGQQDMPVAEVRRLMGSSAVVGLSVETMEQAREAFSLPVDYLGVSPLFATPTKTDTGRPWGLEGLRALRLETELPLVAIGGIGPQNAAEVAAAGAQGLAVVSAICGAADPEAAARTLRASFQKGGGWPG